MAARADRAPTPKPRGTCRVALGLLLLAGGDEQQQLVPDSADMPPPGELGAPVFEGEGLVEEPGEPGEKALTARSDEVCDPLAQRLMDRYGEEYSIEVGKAIRHDVTDEDEDEMVALCRELLQLDEEAFIQRTIELTGLQPPE